ncbi:MAG: hypothetical protein RIT08_262 [Actinomycetota bacterium]|jgi:hypothetical protein
MSNEYIAGSCNIGKGEVRRRKFVALIGAVITLTTATTLFTTDQSRIARLSIFIPAIIFAIGFVQSRKKFCLAYGLAGTFNFGGIGDVKRVQSNEDRIADRKTALSILAQSAMIAIAITGVVFVLPL